MIVRAPSLEQQHGRVALFAEACGHGSACRAGTDDDEVELFGVRSHCAIERRAGRAYGRSVVMGLGWIGCEFVVRPILSIASEAREVSKRCELLSLNGKAGIHRWPARNAVLQKTHQRAHHGAAHLHARHEQLQPVRRDRKIFQQLDQCPFAQIVLRPACAAGFRCQDQRAASRTTRLSLDCRRGGHFDVDGARGLVNPQLVRNNVVVRQSWSMSSVGCCGICLPFR